VYARTNVQSAHEPTVNVPLVGVQGLSDEVSEGESEILILRGINVLRHVPGGIVIWGARTTSPNPEWKYVNVRRLFIFLEQSIDRGLQWAVFEPNGPTLWAAVRATVERFLSTGWKSGALAGQKAEEAYFVRCDQSTMSQADIDAGRFIAIVGVAPLRPAEFVIIRITGQTAPCSA
jgi:phage tail sheath protein FI